MNTFFLIMLFIFGTMFGSFASVLIYRIKSGEDGMWAGRSHCKTCDRNLSALELIPLLSWVIQGGKCRGCKKKISSVYPFLELTMGFLFAQVGFFLIESSLIFSGDIFEIIKLGFFLCIIFLTVIYVFYDILYLEIPESILLIANIGVLGAVITQTIFTGFFDSQLIFFDWLEFNNGANMIYLQILLALVVFGGLYTIMLAELREIWDILILIVLWIAILGAHIYLFSENSMIVFHSPLISGLLGALALFSFFFAQIVVSRGTWMGGGDLRIAILAGMIVGISLTFPAGFITYISGSIIGVGIILFSKVKNKVQESFQHQIPFGPFIAIGYLSVMFFHTYISSFISWYF